MKMLQSSVQLASTLTDNGHDMLKFVERVRAARQGLEALAANFMMEDADRFNLRQSSGDSGTNAFAQGDVTLPSVVLPSTLKRTEAGDVDLDTVRRRSKINLAGLPRLEQDQSRLLTAKTLDDIIGWIGSTPWDGDLANQLLLAEVESLLFTTASSGSIDAAAMTIDVDHIVKLKGLVASYKRALEQFSGGVFRMSVELFSRETLVCWIAYAVVFAATRKKLWPREMESFGVCLRAADLQHMVLADKLAVEAARKLADYLHSQTRPGSEVFCLADGGEATFSLAGKVARASRELHGLWASEQKAAKGRREAHWATVIWQQRKLIQLRNELGDLEARLAYRKKVLEEAKEAMECRKQYSGYRKACRSHTGSCECQRCLAYKEASDAFNETEKAIAPIVEAIRINERLEPILQPLPEDETTALRVLFFMHMPMEFRTLSHLSFQAQQMLLGRKWISDDAVTAAVERPSLTLWSTDQGEVFAALVDELQVRIAEIAQTPREHEAVLLLADMAVYVSHWNDECKNLVRSCLVKVPQEWARDLDDQVQDAAANRLGEEVIPALRAKQCTFHMYGVLCYGGSDDLSTGDIANMCKLQMLAHNRELYAGGVAGLDKGNLSLKVRSLNVMARRSSQIAQLGKSDPSFITAAVKLVLGDIPPCVSWVPVDGTTACFEAQHDGHLYSTNLLTGAVLLDGEPPGWLPIDITQDDLYLRVFRKTRFEVVRVSNGVFKTTRATKGRRYEFSLRTGGGELVIMEIDEEPRETLELLRHNGAWAEDLPELLDKTEDYTGNGIGLGGELVLVKEDNAVFSTLAKFENRAVGPSAVIHAYLRPDGVLDIDLPRFGLSFRVDPSSPRQNRAGDRASGITCVGHDGYQLACDQQLQDTLPGLTRYLVLVREEETMVLVPRGKMVVREGKTSRVWIECDNEECEHSELQVFSYMLHHRWQQLDAGGLSARLQLAAMYAATSTSLPDPRAGMTGTEKALELIRRCPANHPLQEGDGRQVLSVIDMSGGTPALAILCGDLLESSRSLDFLHPAGRSASCSGEGPYALEDAMTAYTSECLIGEYNARRRLSDAEEVRIMGIQVRGHQSLWHEPAVKAGLVDLQSCPISAQLVQEEEDAVRETKEDLTIPTSWKEPERPYPLEVPQGDILAADLHAELRSSWKAHQLSLGTLSSLDLTKVRSLHERFAKRRGRVESLRKVAEKFVLDALVDFGSSDERAISYGMQRLAGLVPTAAAQDLPPFQWSTERARMFNPFLSEEATSGLIVAVALWLRLCVLEDKLGRLQRWTGASGAEALVWQEMQVTRTWNPTEHPKWLAFEAESGLQIRPAQAEVALHMMNNPGEIVQLNMGEGKTRVILPLLVLHWSVPSGDAAVVRLHFVEALLGEAFDYLHHVLSGTLLECPVFLLPFNRDVILTLDRAQAMRGCLERCRRVGGAVLVTPEHRQSLYLKGLELIKVAPAVSDEINRLQGMSFRDVFDESDELFHHRKQLVYAVGGLQTLPALEGRVVAVQALLRVLKHRNRFPKLARLLSEPDVAVEETSVRLERFEPLRLLLGPALDAIKHDLHAALLDAVFTKPPYEMLWVSNLEETMRVKVVTVVLNEVADAEQTLGKSALVDDTHWQQVLALRGLLAHGTLLHCLQMRPRVNYGVSRPAGAKKRMAVPFRASNTPADRSEFRQPDVAIVYTVLSYYYDGLSPDEFRQVLTMLLEKVAESAQKDIYNMWLAEVQVEKEEHRVKIEDVFRVDPTNDPQMDLLYHYFAHNFEVRKSSDQRLPSLSSTNGKMLDLMMLTERYVTLEVPTTDRARARPLEVWKMLLNLAVKEGAHALVDSGALLGSISGQEAAVFLLSPEGGLSNEFRGVVFFDPDQGTAAIGNGWMVLDRVGRYAALAESGLNAAEAFSIYDEARCRGADLKLSPEATALLTIGPGNMKDKVMQAAGRLRLLGRSNQSVVFVGTPDVSTKIGEVAGLSSRERITARDVLGYVMANTVEATRSGLLAWARQGLDFSVTFGRPQRAEHDEVLTLDAAYGAGHRLFPVDKMVRQAVEKISRHKGDVHMPELSKDILSRTGRYGKTVIVSRDSALGGECEREMDLALEEEEEVEREVPKRTPRQETDWEYATALAVESLDQLLATVKVQITPLAEAWGGRLSADAQMSSVRSSSAHRVYCTLNFMLAVEVKTHDAPLDDYLRPVDAALSFANGDVVLLSEREADGILLATSKSSSQPVPPVGTRPSCTGSKLIHLSYTISELDEPRLEKNPLMRATKRQTEVPLVPRPTEVANAALEMVWVFGGWTTVPKHAKDAVKTLVKGGRHAVTHIVAVRGHAHMLPRSDLERLLT
eukprot:g3353.t1